MRVGMVCPYSLTEPGGVQTQVLGLADALRDLGCEVRVIAPCDGPAPGRDVIGVGRSFGIAVNGSRAPMAPHPAAAARAIAAARRGHFDVLHLHEPMAPSITIPVLIAHSAPIVATFHAAGDRTPYERLGRPLRRLSHRIDSRVAVSDEARALAERHLGGTYEVLFNAVDLTPRPAACPPPSTRHGILFLGRHEPRKGLEVLLESMRDVRGVELRIAGEGPSTARLRNHYRHDDRLTWLGQLTEVEKIAQIQSAVVLCAPSLDGESFGVVLLEAMAAGTPIVASDLPAYRAVARHDREALLVPPGDARALSLALRRVVDEPALADRLRANGSARCKEFAMTDLAQRYLAIYERTAVTAR